MDDLINRQSAIDAIDEIESEVADGYGYQYEKWRKYFCELPSAQPEKRTEKRTETHACDLIDRQAAQTELMMKCERYTLARESHGMGHVEWSSDLISVADAMDAIRGLPSAQPERTCVNCGRTVNNGGWYADGRTRCPIEEYYALPKDGYCHLWEKRNITDDDYPERREE